MYNVDITINGYMEYGRWYHMSSVVTEVAPSSISQELRFYYMRYRHLKHIYVGRQKHLKINRHQLTKVAAAYIFIFWKPLRQPARCRFFVSV